jgi:hypothetical protein
VDDWAGAGNSVWIGLLQPGGTRYVQSGYRSWNPFGFVQRRIFLEWKDDGGHTRIEWEAPAVDSIHDFQLVYASAPSTSVRFYYDSALYYTVPSLGWVTDQAIVGGETHSRGIQLYGGKWDYEDIDAMRNGINNGSYINYGSSSSTTFAWDNEWTSQFQIQIFQPNQQTYNGSAQMDLFDWDCF